MGLDTTFRVTVISRSYIFSCLPSTKQVAVFSATYPPAMEAALVRFLRTPVHVRLNADDVQLVSERITVEFKFYPQIGIKQFISLSLDASPVSVALAIFGSVQFRQAIVFCTKAEESVFNHWVSELARN